MASFSERDGKSDCKLAVTRLEFGYFFKQIKFSSFIVVMFVLVSIIEALPGGTCSLVLLKYWLVSMFHVLFISLFSDNFSPQFGIFPFPRIKWLVQIHPYS